MKTFKTRDLEDRLSKALDIIMSYAEFDDDIDQVLAEKTLADIIDTELIQRLEDDDYFTTKYLLKAQQALKTEEAVPTPSAVDTLKAEMSELGNPYKLRLLGEIKSFQESITEIIEEAEGNLSDAGIDWQTEKIGAIHTGITYLLALSRYRQQFPNSKMSSRQGLLIEQRKQVMTNFLERINNETDVDISLVPGHYYWAYQSTESPFFEDAEGLLLHWIRWVCRQFSQKKQVEVDADPEDYPTLDW